MSEDLEALRSRLVIGRKRDGRSVYDESAKAELVALCMQPGASVSRLARECGVNANQVSRWLRESGQGRRRRGGAVAARAVEAFVAVPVGSTRRTPGRSAASPDSTSTAVARQRSKRPRHSCCARLKSRCARLYATAALKAR